MAAVHVEFYLSIDSGNSAVVYEPALAVDVALRTVRAELQQGKTESEIRDMNGNRIGAWQLTTIEGEDE